MLNLLVILVANREKYRKMLNLILLGENLAERGGIEACQATSPPGGIGNTLNASDTRITVTKPSDWYQKEISLDEKNLSDWVVPSLFLNPVDYYFLERLYPPTSFMFQGLLIFFGGHVLTWCSPIFAGLWRWAACVYCYIVIIMFDNEHIKTTSNEKPSSTASHHPLSNCSPVVLCAVGVLPPRVLDGASGSGGCERGAVRAERTQPPLGKVAVSEHKKKSFQRVFGWDLLLDKGATLFETICVCLFFFFYQQFFFGIRGCIHLSVPSLLRWDALCENLQRHQVQSQELVRYVTSSDKVGWLTFKCSKSLGSDKWYPRYFKYMPCI